MTKKNNIRFEEIKKENPFTTPDHYFDNFSARMADKINEKSSSRVNVLAWVRPKYAAVFAFAGITLIIVIGVFVFNPRNTPLSSQEMVEAYKYAAIQDLNDEQLAQIVAERQARVDTSASYQKDVIEYLSKENIDINSIIEAQ